jgi:acetolactate decarboxylase
MRTKLINNIKLLFLLFLFITFSLSAQRLFQVSYYEALSKGKPDGICTISELLAHGNTGLGGFDALDGEMIMLDGKVYQVPVSGKVISPDLSSKVCFAAVYDFKSNKSLSVQGDSNMYNVIDRLAPDKDITFAIKISGLFEYVKTRSVPAQKKPYPPLSEIVKTQSVFEKKQVKGTVVGIRTPSYKVGLNPIGYHLHFISSDGTFGGHLLEMRPNDVKCEIMPIDEMIIKFPSGELK